MMDGPQLKACEDAIYGCTQLATAYPLLFEFLEPGRTGDASEIRAPRSPASRPALRLDVSETIGTLEQTAYWTDACICHWMNEPRTRWPVWHDGTPNPEVSILFAQAAARLPAAAEWAGNQIYDLADAVTHAVEKAREVLGQQDPAELAGRCPNCHELTLVRLPRWLACAVPDCYENRNLPE